ncbi:MAG: rRNA maturation RNase YbeY [Clostridiales bacterium]|nr:rRNA maturation RNase YbeY [Clostridiales bacterium]
MTPKRVIYIENEQEAIKPEKELLTLLRDTVGTCLDQEGFSDDCEIDITLTTDDRIQEINKEFRSIDRPTDVLSFPMVDMSDGVVNSAEGDYDLDEELLMLGDIVISTETALRQAREYGHGIDRELAFLTAHGVYHLLGYDHMNEGEEKAMMEKQEKALNKLGLKRE